MASTGRAEPFANYAQCNGEQRTLHVQALRAMTMTAS
jgi:hypothetical protein